MLICENAVHVCPAQNFFRSYPKLAGMTGTAATEVAEFNNIYNLNVAVVPTNKARHAVMVSLRAHCGMLTV